MSTILKATKNNVFVKLEEVKKQTESGFLIPESSQKKRNIATVISCGKDCTEFKEGDLIMFSGIPTNEIIVNDEKLILLKEEDIVAVFTKE